MRLNPDSAIELDQLIKFYGYDFLDFGCSKGASLEWACKVLGGLKGLGIDIDSRKVNLTVSKGFDACEFDILRISDRKQVDFVVMSHLLEHIPDLSVAMGIVRKACQVARKFVFIKQPFFDADSYLLEHGLKMFYSDWKGHPNSMTSLDFFKLMRDLKASGLVDHFVISAKKKVIGSMDPAIHPLASSRDRHFFDEQIDPPKDCSLLFSVPVFQEIVVIATMSGGFDGLDALASAYGLNQAIFDSRLMM